jgi:hypothetical protein
VVKSIQSVNQDTFRVEVRFPLTLFGDDITADRSGYYTSGLSSSPRRRPTSPLQLASPLSSCGSAKRLREWNVPRAADLCCYQTKRG